VHSSIVQKMSGKYGIIGHNMNCTVVVSAYSYRTSIVHAASFCMVLHDNLCNNWLHYSIDFAITMTEYC